jgi:hypothetical protein
MQIQSSLNDSTALGTLKDNFLETSTVSMPIAGMIFWAATGMAGMLLPPQTVAFGVAFGSGLIFPLALLIDRLRGRKPLYTNEKNPLSTMFMQSIVMVALLWPLVIVGGAGKPVFVVLGAAILTGIVWIPYGWAAADPVGMRHAVARAVLCYAAYLFAPSANAITIISAAVLACYGYSLLQMRRPRLT